MTGVAAAGIGTGTSGSEDTGSLGLVAAEVAGCAPVESVDSWGVGASAGGSGFLDSEDPGAADDFASGGLAESGSGKKAVSG